MILMKYAPSPRFLFTIVLLVALVSVLVSPGVSADDGGDTRSWNQYQADARNSGYYGEDPNGESWLYETDQTATSTAVRSEDRVYVYDSSGGLYVLDAGSGDEIWVKQFEDTLYKAAIVSPRAIYLGERRGRTHAISSQGDTVWSLDLGDNALSSPAVSDGVVYVGVDRSIMALGEEDGSLLWQTGVKGSVVPPVKLSDSVYVSAFDKVSTTEAEGRLVRMSRRGVKRWVFRDQGVIVPPAVGEKRVYTGNWSGGIYALDPQDGSVVWRNDLGTTISAPALQNQTLYYGGGDGRVYAVNSSTGSVRWEFEGAGKMAFSPAIAGDRIYAASMGGALYSIDSSSGEELWSVSVDDWVLASPTAAGKTVYVSTDKGVYALNNETLDSVDGVSRKITDIETNQTVLDRFDSVDSGRSNETESSEPESNRTGDNRTSDVKPPADDSKDTWREPVNSTGRIESADSDNPEIGKKKSSGGRGLPPVLLPFLFGLLLVGVFVVLDARSG